MILATGNIWNQTYISWIASKNFYTIYYIFPLSLATADRLWIKSRKILGSCCFHKLLGTPLGKYTFIYFEKDLPPSIRRRRGQMVISRLESKLGLCTAFLGGKVVEEIPCCRASVNEWLLDDVWNEIRTNRQLTMRSRVCHWCSHQIWNFCNILLNRRTEKWSLFVLYDKKAGFCQW